MHDNIKIKSDLKRVQKIEADEAISMIKSGQCIAFSPVCAEPQTLVNALVEDKDRLEDVKIFTMMPMGECPYVLPEMEGHFSVKTFSVGPRLMDAVNRGQAEYVPCHLSQIPKFFSEGIIQVDMAFIQLSPPDSHGYCSLGISIDYTRSLINNAKIVIAEINERMPRTLGDTFVHLSGLDYMMESSHQLLIAPPPKIGEVERKIAQFTSELIPDGSVIQVGIGNIPEAILNELKQKKDLSIHTGIFSDGVLSLVESGAIDEKRNGQMVAMDLIGTSSLYEFCHNNPLVEMRPINYTHDINVLSQIKGIISISSAIQMDLSGQVNAEMLGETLINGVGGQLDFIRGAEASPGGKAIIAFPSTARRGKVSRIVNILDTGVTVTVGRADIDYVVTEYGIARLKGKSLSERAKELIAIAHPDFREELSYISH
ncbi:MAG: acetyl-CoA hydrolase/transferase C-terminal domain-containing protein [Thermodesulfobacteriota bacterium]|nr:acetyl-CoA hydrolase/transferase C-terminal domain-containing protein [Thermodesulfobacteriota bacterium]